VVYDEIHENLGLVEKDSSTGEVSFQISAMPNLNKEFLSAHKLQTLYFMRISKSNNYWLWANPSNNWLVALWAT
jgi:hypothetical protein